MSTRQLRLNSTEQIKSKSQQFIGKKVNVVMTDKTVVFGTVHSIDGSLLKIVNMRLAKVSIPLENISELYYDTKE